MADTTYKIPHDTLKKEISKPEDFTPPEELYKKLIATIRAYRPTTDLSEIEKAYKIASKAHEGQKRKSGEPYIIHPLCVAIILAELELDKETIVAGILHDVVEDTVMTREEIAKEFSEEVALLVDGVTKLTQLDLSQDKIEVQAENLRKMFLAMAKDIRVILIKLADRLHNLRTMQYQSPAKQIEKSRETMDIYAPLAHRLGISKIKVELDDLSMQYLYPEVYKNLKEEITTRLNASEDFIVQMVEQVKQYMKEAGIEAEVDGRVKHLFSIYKKMITQNKTLDQIYDIHAIRIKVDTVRDCYAALGIIHEKYKPIPGRFKDYIAMPKENMYQSLHTTLIGPGGRPFEIQIRTYEMHEQAEYGIAAHWLYKKSGGSSASKTNDAQRLDDQINWLKHSLDWAASDEITDAKEYLHSLKVDLFDQEIFVFTPKGEVMALRAGSTPLDFAYAVHTEVGNHCVGAKINGAVAPLTHEIKTGDRVEILTNKSSKPSRDWLKIVKTPSAKSKIRRYFAAATKDDDAAAGRDMLAKDLRKRGYGISTPRSTRALNAVAEQFNFKQLEDLFAAVGAGKVAPRAVGNKVEQILDPKPEEQLTKAEAIAEVVKQPARGSNRKPQKRGKSASNGIIVKGESNSGLLVRLAHCCNPVTGDDIVGFITRGRGVSVHRANCPNVKGLMEHPERMIDVEWDGAADTLFQVEIVVECLDRMGLLKDVTIAIGNAGGNILSAATSTNREGIATLRFMVEISDASGLDPLLASISSVDSVYDARRLMPGEGGAQLKRRV